MTLFNDHLYGFDLTEFFTELEPESPSVATCSVEHSKQAERYSWDLIMDLNGGTKAMRRAAEKWMPREPGEEPDLYKIRLSRAVLFNNYKDTVDGLADRPFMKPVAIKGELPPRVAKMFSVKDKGIDLHLFARAALRMAVDYGRAHVLVDYPLLAEGDSRKDEIEKGDFPRLKVLNTPAVFFWDEDEITGELREIRWREKCTKKVGEYGDRCYDVIWRMTTTMWQRWERPEQPKDEEKDFVLESFGDNQLGMIPIVTLSLGESSFDSEPPLLDLAYVNLAHWQSLSDQRNALRFARLGILFGSGFTKEDLAAQVTLGPSQMIRSTNELAKLEFVEHSGSAMAIGFKDIELLSAQMETLGQQPLIEKSAQQSATGKEIDEARSVGTLQSWVRLCEVFLRQICLTAAKWTKETVAEDVRFDIFSDFGMSRRSGEDQNILNAMRGRGDLSLPTYLREMRRRGTISELTDIESEVKATESERAALAAANAKAAKPAV